MIPLPEIHPRRQELNDEAHARPPEALTAPQRLSFIALFDDGASRSDHFAALAELCARHGVAPPPSNASHFSGDFGTFRLKWEKHTEFTRYMAIVAGQDGEEPFSVTAASMLPQNWLQQVPGKLIAASHVALVASPDELHQLDSISGRWFAGNPLIGADIGDHAATAVTDFHIHADGFSRFLVMDHTLAPRQAGRMVQRLLEIDAYRVLALMALPVARELAPILGEAEAELVRVTAKMAEGRTDDEPQLLEQLTRLEARIQRRHFETASRFSAAEAYHRLVQRRTRELRERRIEGFQTFEEFVERRLDPAMGTCGAISARQEKLAHRVAQATQLLSTRVEVRRQSESQGVLESMNRRAMLQLRLQQTVEGLSVAAITYYVVGLVSYIAKGASVARAGIGAEVVVALSVPVVLGLVAFGVRRIRKIVMPLRQSEGQSRTKAGERTRADDP